MEILQKAANRHNSVLFSCVGKSKKLHFAVIMVDRAAYYFEMTSLFYKQTQHCESFKRCITKNSVLFPLHSNLYKNIKLNIDY